MNELTEYQESALARISTETLRAARITVSCSPEIQSLFDQAATEGWPTEQLTRALTEALPEYMLDQEVVPEVAHYLAQEFALRDKTQTMLVSAETGQVVGQIPVDALYQPGPVEREFSNQLAVPLARIKPEIEAALVQAQVTRGQEVEIVKALKKRVRSTELQAQEGDPRLLVSTRNGRAKLSDRLRRELPELLTGGSGVVGEFLGLCTTGLPKDAPGDTHWLRITAHAVMQLTDMLSLNLQHDPYTAMKERVRTQWARNLARQVSLLSYCQLSETEVSVHDALDSGLLICDPDTSIALRDRPSLAVDGVPPVVLSKGPFLGIDPNSYVCEAIERQGRWEVAAGFDLALHLDLSAIRLLRFTDVPVSGISVEVL